MDKLLAQDIRKLYEEYVEEMMTESAWYGHSYATSYLSDIRKRTIQLAEIAKEKENITEIAKRVLFCLNTDYDELISMIYVNEKFSSEEKEDIADALNEMFKAKLGNAMENIAEMYKILTNEGVNVNE